MNSAGGARRRPGDAVAAELGDLTADAHSAPTSGETFDDHRRHDVVFGDRLRPALVTEVVERVPLRDDVRLVAAIAAAFVDQPQAAIDGAVGRALQPDIDAGLHGQAAFVERLGAVLLLEILAHLFGEERRDRSDAAAAGRAVTIGFFFDASACSCVM